MSRVDSLVPLLTRKGDDTPQLGFRQGVVASWNAETGQNVINVAGALLVDVPILNTGEAVALKAGHVVGLLTYGGSWFITGRITVPGDADFASASVAFGGAGLSATNFSVNTSAVTDRVTTTIAVPTWADEAIVMAQVNCSLSNTSAGGFYCITQAVIDGTGGGGTGFGLAPVAHASFNDFGGSSASAQRKIVNPGPTITIAGRCWTSGGTVPANVNNIITADAIAVFRSTV